MPCFYPLNATPMPSGKPLVHSRLNYSRKPGDIKLPCGRCLGCRVDRSTNTAVRLVHEAQLHDKCSFLTLTYTDQVLASRRPWWEPTVPYTPPSGEESLGAEYLDDPATTRKPRINWDSLVPRDLQLFHKRLRKHLTTLNPSTRVRHYSVGEYGSLYGRPHYHIALFGEDFSGDRKYWRTSGSYHCYRSPKLEQLWPHGNSEIGELTIDSAAYVAGYIIDKITGPKADDHYRRTNPHTGEDYYLVPEFAHMSRRPGLGRPWLQRYMTDVYPHDVVITNKGRKMRPPRYYDNILKMYDPAEWHRLKFEREMRAKELADDNTPARLHAKEAVLKAKLGRKQHTLETT